MHVFIETSLKRTYMRSSFKTKINNILREKSRSKSLIIYRQGSSFSSSSSSPAVFSIALNMSPKICSLPPPAPPGLLNLAQYCEKNKQYAVFGTVKHFFGKI